VIRGPPTGDYFSPRENNVLKLENYVSKNRGTHIYIYLKLFNNKFIFLFSKSKYK
jgi:hypothetical protein